VTLQVELVSPEGVIYEGEAQMVTARTIGGGDIAFLTGHEPFLGVLDTYPVKVIGEDNSTTVIAAERGFIQCTGERVSVLSDTAYLASDIDVARAHDDRAAAEEALRANGDDEQAKASLRWAQIRLDAAGG